MLLESGLPITFWPEAVLNANFVRNQSLLSGDGVPPSERWFGTPVDLTTLRTFGSQCFSHVPAKQRLKQSILSNNISCFFLGYHNKDEQYYRLLDPSTGRVFYSRTALFDKETLYKHVNPPCDSQQGFDMPIDGPVLDSTGAEVDTAPHR